ncbi:hypothetical protein NA57DRAFT_55333 [Rhizodiscina lignyota]|uniref:Ankyrin repeat protein n=1 Tax=Rhizodiscina lignyota TaxID=1504668 RepID=A0A9P4IG29_9PEZI|nr:hypothetical protein NA57DRAFT_55333 [Rhizodiscina lignyota]
MAGLEESIFYTFEKAVATTYDEVQRYMEHGMDVIQIEEEERFIHYISDIRDELAMIKNVLIQQEEVWNAFWKDRSKEIWKDTKPDVKSTLQRIIERPMEQLPKFKRRIEKIDGDAERVEKWILTQLDLKSKHAGLKESHNSTTLSTAVIGFTIITVVFTPLSFISSLFALPIDKFHRQQINVDNSYLYTTGYIGRWMTVGEIVSLVVTAIAVWLAFYWLKTQGLPKSKCLQSVKENLFHRAAQRTRNEDARNSEGGIPIPEKSAFRDTHIGVTDSKEPENLDQEGLHSWTNRVSHIFTKCFRPRNKEDPGLERGELRKR